MQRQEGEADRGEIQRTQGGKGEGVGFMSTVPERAEKGQPCSLLVPGIKTHEGAAIWAPGIQCHSWSGEERVVLAGVDVILVTVGPSVHLFGR